jgi:hypothetical protein
LQFGLGLGLFTIFYCKIRLSSRLLFFCSHPTHFSWLLSLVDLSPAEFLRGSSVSVPLCIVWVKVDVDAKEEVRAQRQFVNCLLVSSPNLSLLISWFLLSLLISRSTNQ